MDKRMIQGISGALLISILACAGCSGGKVSENLELQHKINIGISDELAFTAEAAKYEGFIQGILYYISSIKTEEITDKLTTYSGILSDSVIISVKAIADGNQAFTDATEEYTGDIYEEDPNSKAEIDLSLRDADGNVIGIAKDFEELRVYMYNTFSAEINPRDYGMDYDIDYASGRGGVRHGDTTDDGETAVGADEGDKVTEVEAPDTTQKPLSLSSTSVYKNVIVYKFMDRAGTLRIYTLHLDNEGKVLSYDIY